MKAGYTFDDMNLVPIHSEIRSRKDPDPSTRLGFLDMRIPIIAAPMNTVCEGEMGRLMSDLRAGSVIHRYATIDRQCDMLIAADCSSTFVAVGATGDYIERAKKLYDCGARRFCVDIANGHSDLCVKVVAKLRDLWPDYKKVDIMAGNVCTRLGAINLEEAGASIIRVGIGGGSVCSTRLVTGFGVPQLTAIAECVAGVTYAQIVSDGGIRSSGDIVKALAMGADAVMIGGLLAGTDQAPGELKRGSNGMYKEFHGMASAEGRSSWYDPAKTSFTPEGISTKVAYKGCAKKIIEELVGGLKVGMSFANATNLAELYENAKWVTVTDNGRREGNPNRKMFNG